MFNPFEKFNYNIECDKYYTVCLYRKEQLNVYVKTIDTHIENILIVMNDLCVDGLTSVGKMEVYVSNYKWLNVTRNMLKKTYDDKYFVGPKRYIAENGGYATRFD